MEAERLERHWLSCMASVGGGGRVTRIAGGLVLSNPRVAGGFANFLLPVGLDPSLLEMFTEVGMAVLAGDQRSPVLFLSPLAGSPEGLRTGLEGLGWRPAGRQSVLVRTLPCSAQLSAVPVAVEELPKDRLSQWGETLAAGYEASPDTTREIVAGWTHIQPPSGSGEDAVYYLASVRGQPAGTGLLLCRNEIAGLYCGAVPPSFRRRGVYRALIEWRMIDAAKRGLKLAVLQTEVGSPVDHVCTKHLGFVRAYEREIWVSGNSGHAKHKGR